MAKNTIYTRRAGAKTYNAKAGRPVSKGEHKRLEGTTKEEHNKHVDSEMRERGAMKRRLKKQKEKRAKGAHSRRTVMAAKAAHKKKTAAAKRKADTKKALKDPKVRAKLDNWFRAPGRTPY